MTLTLADTQYSYTFGARQLNSLFSASTATPAFRWSWLAGVVATGGGHHVAAGGSIIQEEAPVAGTVIYFASSTAGTVINVSYEMELTP